MTSPGQARTLLAVHAHPDDEATSTGAILARYGSEGVRTVVVTCTNGELGDGPGGVKPGEPGHDPHAVAAMRRRELERSCQILNVAALEMLGFHDSGMAGWPQNEAPEAFSRRPLEEAVARLAPVLERYRPDVVVTYDADGFYGHPDHIAAHHATVAALAATGLPARLFFPVVPRSAMARFAEIAREAGVDWEAEGPPDPSLRSLGFPDEELAAVVDGRAQAGLGYDALAAHASQADNAFFLRFGRDRYAEVMGVESFAAPVPPPGAPLDDLFAGI